MTFKTKQSLGNNKNVYFNVDGFEDDQVDHNEQPKLKNRVSRKVKSMRMFDHSDESGDEQHNDENKNS